MSLIPVFPRGSKSAEVSNTDDSIDIVNRTVYTFTSQSLGVADSTRKVVIEASAVGTTASSRSISTLTVGGVSATPVIAQKGTTPSTDDHYATELWQADVPTGTTGNVVVTWNAAMSQCGIGVYRVIGATSAANDTGSNYSATSNLLADTLNIPAGGIAIAGNGTDGTATTTWVGVTEDHDGVVEGDQVYSGASDEFATQQTGLTISANPTSGSRHRLVMASWGKG